MNKLTIITVVFNDAASLMRTIDSIREQDFKDFQYIIIDGGSKDGTLEIIHTNSDLIDMYISEPDSGIYDAMNKGLKFAQGEYVHYLNAGDLILNNAYQEILLRPDIKKFDVLYGDLLIQGSELKYISRPLKTIFYEMPIFHPAVFIKSEILRQFSFNINYKIAGDYDLILRLYLANKRFKYVPVYISTFNLKGVSNTNFKRAIFETGKSIFLNSPYSSKWSNLCTYLQGKIRFMIFNFVYNTIGSGNYNKIKAFLSKALT
jgi:glycosyltransferase involved in cell wall biosynthesis